MYVPTNIAASNATYAPVAPAASPALFQAPDVGGARQTQIAVTGPGAALIPNTANARSQAYAIQPRPAYIAAQFLAQDISAQEAQAFFEPTTQPIVQATPQRQPLQSPALPDTSNESEVDATIQSSPTLTGSTLIAPLTTSRTPVTVEPTLRAAGVAAYSSANALLASPPEINTSL